MVICDFTVTFEHYRNCTGRVTAFILPPFKTETKHQIMLQIFQTEWGLANKEAEIEHLRLRIAVRT